MTEGPDSLGVKSATAGDWTFVRCHRHGAGMPTTSPLSAPPTSHLSSELAYESNE